MSPKFVLTYLGDVWTIKMVCFGDQDCNFFGLIAAIFPNVTFTYIPSKMLQTSKRLQKLVYGSIDNAWSLSFSQVSTTPLQCSEDDKMSLTHSLTEWQGHLLSCPWNLLVTCRYDCVDAYVRIMSDRCFSLFCVCMQNGITPFSFSSVGKRQTESSN